MNQKKFDYEVMCSKAVAGAAVLLAFAKSAELPMGVQIGAAIGGMVIGLAYDIVLFQFKKGA